MSGCGLVGVVYIVEVLVMIIFIVLLSDVIMVISIRFKSETLQFYEMCMYFNCI